MESSDNIKMETRFQFLEGLYLPGYMGLQTEAYDKRSGVFDFIPIEPPVTILSTKYLTPRGAHIFISQAGFCLLEYVLEREEFDMNVDEYKVLTAEGRLKIVELNQKFKREVGLENNLQGRMDLTRIRWGKMPMIKMDFDLADKSITGNFIGVLAPKPMSQMNADILRRK